MNLFAAIRPLARVVIDTLLPPHCLACDTPVPADGMFCGGCFRQVNFVSAPFCRHCGVPLPFGGAGQSCGRCAATPPLFGQVRAALRYDEAAKRLILPFKYADRPEAAGGLARLMAQAGGALLAEAELLVPVPLHRLRLRQRRYNQAVLLAVALGRAARVAVTRDALVRLKPTLPLAGMGLAARLAALENAIVVRPGRQPTVADRRILLIDDVMTSGATANACAAALLAAGAASVAVLTIARVADPRFD